jgi:NAD-dependent dihydropyrimidine dehydrogenase PreA subunit
MKVKRKIIEIDEDLCDGCGQCVPSCAEGALKVVDGKAKMVAEIYCDGLGACLGECPMGALRIIEREADEFDEGAVKEHLRSMPEEPSPQTETLPCGCPSTQLQAFAPPGVCQKANAPVAHTDASSELCHWPVQIRLVPPTAPFLKGADLLVAADCTPVAYPNFHRDLLKGKAVMLGCPKFDDAQEYIQKFADIFKVADIKSVTVAVMEVPCCQGLPYMVEKGMAAAGKKIPVEKVVVSPRGEILSKEKLAA